MDKNDEKTLFGCLETFETYQFIKLRHELGLSASQVPLADTPQVTAERFINFIKLRDQNDLTKLREAVDVVLGRDRERSEGVDTVRPTSPGDSQLSVERDADRKTMPAGAGPKGKSASTPLFVAGVADAKANTAITPRTTVICPLHGIRTHAVWQRQLADLASSRGWVCRLDRWSYGRFSLPAFLSPWSREGKLAWLRRQYDAEINDRRFDIAEGQAPSVVAHSFGTYILGYTLLRFAFIRFNKVILCGSILPRDFPWDKLIERGQVQAVRNEYGVRDPWVKRVSCFVRGTGPSGAFGFTCKHDRLEQAEFEYDHGDYFGIDHMDARWMPFLDKPLALIPAAQNGPRIPRPQASPPWCLYGLLVLTALAMIAALLAWQFGWPQRFAATKSYVPPDPFYSVSLTHNATMPVVDDLTAVVVELKLDKPIPNDSGIMVLSSSKTDGNAPPASPIPRDQFPFTPFVGPNGEMSAKTSYLHIKLRKDATNGFIQRIRDTPAAHVFLDHNQPKPPDTDDQPLSTSGQFYSVFLTSARSGRFRW